ncbi:MAG: hypothetical protein M1514_01440 [Patescibacteria group bacterium]|nr:hypothetical protein [Patescibacteria group bacterium]
MDDTNVDNTNTSPLIQPSLEINAATADFLNLENLIKTYMARVESIKQELKKQKELLDDSFESDAIYKEHEEKAKEAIKIKAETKQQILKNPTLQSITQKVDDLRSEVKELQDTLSDYLLQYQKLTGASEIEGEDGETRIIVNTARLVKGSPKFSKE